MPQETDLRQEVASLAMKLVFEEFATSPDFAASLEAASGAVQQIRDRAEAAGKSDLVRLAAELRDVLMRPENQDLQALSRALQSGLDQMQQVLDDGPSEGASPGLERKQTSLGQDPELVSDFVLESREHLSTIETCCLNLDQNPGDAETVHSLFRAFHTIKGLAGFLEFHQIREVAHEVETVLDLARGGQLTMAAAVVDVILESADYVKAQVNWIEAGLQGKPASPPPGNSKVLEHVSGLMTLQPAAPAAAAAAAPQEAAVQSPATTKNGPANAKAVRVDTGKLDYLVDMAGEMVIAQAMVRHDPDLAGLKSHKLQRNLSQLARITAEIQKTSMSMRLVPIGQLFQRITRQVRDLSRKVGKPVELDIAGEDTEIDRTIVEELSDPLMHMVRNSLDHGIEDPEARQASGKSRVARIGLRACHQAGHIVIEVSDDGRGLNRARILKRALEKGLISSPDIAPAELFNIIFEPGFSTATQITEVSGRGVGMDVVRRHIQKLRGRVEVQSTEGQGTSFTMKLPLTLAIIDGLVVGVGKERYVVPLFAVREMFRPMREAVSSVQGRGEIVVVHGKLLTITRLYRRFQVEPRFTDPSDCLLIVAEAEGKRFCLMVDEMIGKQEVVIKTLGDRFKQIRGIAGGAILGDGRVGLILDLDGLAKDEGEGCRP